MSVNCGRVGNVEKDTKRGYFVFDPTGRHPHDPPPRCQFFLKLAHWILVDSKGPSVREKSSKNEAMLPWKDSVVAPWYTNVDQFYKYFTSQRLNFGCVITDKDNEKCDVKDGRFVQLSLPPNYMFRPVGEGTGEVDEKKEQLERAQSGIKSLMFIDDFCVMIHNVTFDKNGKVVGNITFDKNGHFKDMGTKLPEAKRIFNQYIQDVQISMYPLTADRIASIQWGSVREESEEYKSYLCQGKTKKNVEQFIQVNLL